MFYLLSLNPNGSIYAEIFWSFSLKVYSKMSMGRFRSCGCIKDKLCKIFCTQILPITVERMYDGNLLLAGGRAHQYWWPHNQCDQMVLLFFNIWPFAIMKISPIMSQICQSPLSILPNKKWTVKNLPKTGKLLHRVAKFHPILSHCSQSMEER